ncbi:DUF86 domain-containing protein [Pedobacter sp. HMF7647]|uniref:DUF86 domain-containing protein n=1 Tax=Hufsiella arboris TaxID=2695275 RepID=A0A7K1YBF1_9SPHI|nr:HepT-like ribonuclease domain-containing protein [Hufsiella arboris]MXV51760.1 DUF86 domain-containing protein [Hufsiella arboris]
MSKSIIEFLIHIQTETGFILKSSADKSFDDLLNDSIWQRAVIRSLEVIGETAKKIDSDFRLKHSKVEWIAMSKMRDKLIHHYFESIALLISDLKNSEHG